MEHRSSIHSERGLAAVVGILIFLFLAIVVVVGIVAGLDNAVVKNGGKTMFSPESNIGPLMENIREKKRRLANTFDDEHGESSDGSYSDEPQLGEPDVQAVRSDPRDYDSRDIDSRRSRSRNNRSGSSRSREDSFRGDPRDYDARDYQHDESESAAEYDSRSADDRLGDIAKRLENSSE